MHEFKEGKLHSGSKQGPVVTERKQAIAIALAEANAMKMKYGGGVGDEVVFSVDDETLDMLLYDHHGEDLDYVNVSGDSYYKLNRRDFDRFMDAAISRGFNVDYENDEDAVIYVLEDDQYDKGGSMYADGGDIDNYLSIIKIEKGRDTGMAYGAMGDGYIVTF